MLKLEELKVFLATAEAGSFAAAAEQLEVAPSVVSKTIKALESKLNTTLFNRTTRKVSITSEGEWLRGEAARTLANLEAIRARFIDDRSEPEGRLTVDAATPFALHAIAPVLSRFTERYPKVQVCLESNETVADLIAKRVDVAIRIGELKDSSLKAVKIGATRRALFAAPAYLARHGEPRGADDLARHKCLGFTAPEALNRWPLLTAGGEPLVVTPHLRANSGETLKQLAVFGNGIACLSDFTVVREVARGELLPVLAERIEPHAIPIYAVYYSQRAVGRHIRLFLDFLKENAVLAA